MTEIALLGAGGKMGLRLATNLRGSDYRVRHVEINPEGQKRLVDALGVECMEPDAALAGADVVLMAVPDNLIGRIAHGFIDRVGPGTRIIMLDAAAPYDGQLPDRGDVTYFVTHPCHPPLFNDETEPEARADFFGGVAAKQNIVCALMQGPEEDYALCEDIARRIYRPVMRAHRVTLEHLAILEPALSETVGATLVQALRDATDEAVRRGVPREAAMDFMLGHLSIELSILFDVFPGQFSDGAKLAIAKAQSVIFQEGWLDRVFAPEAVRASVADICRPD